MELHKIIIADDHSFIRLGLVQILKEEYPKLEIIEVGDAESLLNEVALQDFDLVISDLEMPGKNGFEALAQIKLLKPDLPVLILSIYPEDLYAIKLLKAGASGYIFKNSAPEQLIEAVHRIESGKRFITPNIAEKLMNIELDLV